MKKPEKLPAAVTKVQAHGFGMPPRGEAQRTAASDAAMLATTGKTVPSTETKAATAGGDSALEEFKDKFANFYISDPPPPKLKSSMEADATSSSPDVTVAGNLRRNLPAWERMGASSFILETIREGYKIQIYQTPHSA